MTTIKDIGREFDHDFTLWYKARDDDPEDFVSPIPSSERAFQWCAKNNIPADTILDIDNDQARQLYDHLVAQGFKVTGCS
jgi:hypothetical protein